jgi:hypothetical protein
MDILNKIYQLYFFLQLTFFILLLYISLSLLPLFIKENKYFF